MCDIHIPPPASAGSDLHNRNQRSERETRHQQKRVIPTAERKSPAEAGAGRGGGYHPAVWLLLGARAFVRPTPGCGAL